MYIYEKDKALNIVLQDVMDEDSVAMPEEVPDIEIQKVDSVVQMKVNGRATDPIYIDASGMTQSGVNATFPEGTTNKLIEATTPVFFQNLTFNLGNETLKTKCVLVETDTVTVLGSEDLKRYALIAGFKFVYVSGETWKLVQQTAYTDIS